MAYWERLQRGFLAVAMFVASSCSPLWSLTNEAPKKISSDMWTGFEMFVPMDVSAEHTTGAKCLVLKQNRV